MYQISDYDFSLPDAQIAQKPNLHRDQSRLLILDRQTGRISHRNFFEILDFLNPDDLLVVNNTRVIPGRLFGRKESGGKVEILLLDYAGGLQSLEHKDYFECPCLIKASKGPKPGSRLSFGPDLQAEVMEGAEGKYRIRFYASGPFEEILDGIGHVPLPPYIKRESDTDAFSDRESYQTVYAQEKGAIAAPTAGLHFSPELLNRIRAKSISIVEITLHVGYGTFLPIRAADIRNHKMHAERYSISKNAADRINRQKMNKGRIIAVGTTSVRTLEFATNKDGFVEDGPGVCDLFIYPGYTFQTVSGIITNFHLPKSSLLMLVSAFADRSTILSAYQEAVQAGYQFFSYGDAMFIQ